MMPIQNTGADSNPLSLGSSRRGDGQAAEEGGFGKALRGEMESVRQGANVNKNSVQTNSNADNRQASPDAAAPQDTVSTTVASASAEGDEGLFGISDSEGSLFEVVDADAEIDIVDSTTEMVAEVAAFPVALPVNDEMLADTAIEAGEGGKDLPSGRPGLPLELPATRRANATALTSTAEVDQDSELAAEDFLASLRRVRSEDAVSRPVRENPSGSPRTEQAPIATAVAEATRKPVTLEEGLTRLSGIRVADTTTSAVTPSWAPAGSVSAAPASGASTPAALAVNVPVGQQGWDQALGERVAWMTRQGGAVQEAHIQLNPREMGPVEVRVLLNQDQASVSFAAQNPAARDALEAAMPRLREMLNESGLALADSQVSHQFPEQRQQAMDQRPDNGRGSVHDGREDLASDGSDGETVMTTGTTVGMVDFYA